MIFITLAKMTALCLFIPVAVPFAALRAVILLYLFPQQTLALLGALLLAMGAYIYFNHRRKRLYTLEDLIPEAIETVSACDIPEEELADDINAQARLMTGIQPDEPWPEMH